MSLFCKSQKTLFFPWIKFFTKKTKNKNIVWIMIILNYTRSYATIYIFFYFVLLCAEMNKTSSYSATSGLSGNTKQHP